MNPGLIATFVARGLYLAASSRGNGPGQPTQHGALGIWAAGVWFVLVPIEIILFTAMISGQLYLLPPLLALITLTFPWAFTRWILIPLGLPRLAYLLTFTSDFAFRADRRGSAAMAGAWALARRPRFDDQAADWITAQLASSEPLRGAGIFASGLLLAARGDLTGARALIESMRDLDPRATPPAVRRLAHGWLAAEAAARGDWLRVSELGATLGGGGREAWLLSGVAQSLRLEPFSPGRLGLWLRWALAPHRRRTLPIVRRALGALDGAFVEPDEEVRPEPPAKAAIGDDFALALSLHTAMLHRGEAPVTGEDLRAVGQAWDAVLGDRGTERALAERAMLIGAAGVQPALGRLRDAIEEDLAAVVLASDLPLAELGGRGETAERVRLRVRDRLLSEVEAMSDAIRRRADEKRSLPAVDEWREWTALERKYARGVRLAGADFRRLAFYKVHPDACSLAVWLFNERKQRPLGNAIFRFLLAEAESVEDQRAITLQTKNVSCGI